MAEPRRRKRRSVARRPAPPQDAQGEPLCYCGRPRVPGTEYCLAHTVHDFLADSARRATRRGKTWEALALSLGTAVVENVQKHDVAAKAFMLYQLHQQQKKAAAAAGPPPPVKLNPFAVLHLDPKTATVEDVKRVQRKLAEIYHSDKSTPGVASDAMAEVNAAAEAAIKAIKAR